MRQISLFVVAVVLFVALPKVVLAQGAAPLLDESLVGCYDVAVTGVGLFNDTPPTGIQNTVRLPAPDGPVVAAYIEWVGVEDATPGGDQLDGESTLRINGVDVIGTLAEPLDLSGNAGYDPRAHASAGPGGWFSWHANIGPTGLNLIPAQFGQSIELTISGWDSPAKQTNGATISLIYDTGACETGNEIQFLTGVNWYHYHAGLHQFSELLVYPVDPAPIARIVRMVFSHAGTDKSQATCRGGAVWMTADDGSRPLPRPRDFDLVAVGDNDGDGVKRGYGINGGVEILNDPFTSASLPCTPAINRAPDEPYAAGHPYPDGAGAAPYRAMAIDPPAGGDVGDPGEWGVITARILIPANARWVAFQLESEPDQLGESGSWVGGGVFIIVPTATVGDRVWHDRNGNGIQESGEPGIGGVAVDLIGSDGQVIRSTVTSSAGLYSFREAPAGDYGLRFSTPAGFVGSPQDTGIGPNGDAVDSDAHPRTGITAMTNLQPSEADFTWDAGFYRPASVGDTVWLDSNRDGLQDQDEPGINGVRVELVGAGADRRFDTADDILLTTTTGATNQGDGRYSFDDLAPGRYYVRFGPLAGHIFTQQSAGDGTNDSDADPASGRTDPFDLLSDARNLDIDAGMIALGSAIDIEKTPDIQRVEHGGAVEFTIAVHNSGELPLSSVYVTDPASPSCDRAIGNLAVGASERYTCIVENVRHDFVNTALANGRDAFGATVEDRDDAAVDVLPAIAVEKQATPDAVHRSGDPVTFTVKVINRVSEPLTLTELTDDIHGDLNGQGTCTLPQTIAPGDGYTCSFSVVVFPGDAGETDTVTAKVVDDEGNVANGNAQATVTPKPGQSGIGDRVWYDTNANGLQDDNEPGVAGMKVQLFSEEGKLIREARTDDRGVYLFIGLDEGDYYVVFVADMFSAPFSSFTTVRDDDPARNSDVRTVIVPSDRLTGMTETFALPRDFIDRDRDAGLIVPLGITDAEPTAIELVNFTTRSNESGIEIIWVTAAEVDTAGFQLLRSTTVDRADAAMITPQLMPGLGAEGGSYRYMDESALPGLFYHYWLVEIEDDLDSSQYGPIRGRIEPASSGFTIYLPAITLR